MAVTSSVVTRIVIIVATVLIAAGGGAAWWIASAADPVTTDSIGDSVQTRARGQLPEFVEGNDVKALYAFAVAHPEILGFMPCVCGCVDLGHTSNRSCYVKAETPDRVTFTSHAAT
jgi:hypothetical protein